MREETQEKPSSRDTRISLVGSFKKACKCKGMSDPPTFLDGSTRLTGDSCDVWRNDLQPPRCIVCGTRWHPNDLK